jgi:hypothetical protein
MKFFEVSSITNEAGEKDYPYFWTSTTHLSHVDAKSAVYISFGRALGRMNGKWMDVHGAGAQRSDPKNGDPEDYPDGFGPQGDARRIFNYARCIRGEAKIISVNSENVETSASEKQSSSQGKTPPQEAINACEGKDSNDGCNFQSPRGKITGSCKNIEGTLACVP